MQSPEENKKQEQASPDEVAELKARIASMEAENEQLRGQAKDAIVQRGNAEMGIIKDPELVEVQFAKDFSYGGTITPNPRVWRHASFSVPGGAIVRMPKDLARNLERDFGDKMVVGKGFKAQAVGRVEFDSKTGARKLVESEVSVKELKERMYDVGLPCVK